MIGDIIKYFREEKHMLKSVLAKGICSEKYIYLIEKGERNPSAEILGLLSNRLGIDLLGYYPYLNCKDPIKVRSTHEIFERLRRQSKFIDLAVVTNKALNLDDFKKKPWVYEIIINQLAELNFIRCKFDVVVYKTNLIIRNEKVHLTVLQYINFLLLRSVAYQMLNKIVMSEKDVNTLKSIIELHITNSYFFEHIIAIRINEMALLNIKKVYDQLSELAEETIKFQEQYGRIERIHYSFAFLAIAQFELKLFDQALSALKCCINHLITYDKPIDVSLLFAVEEFRKTYSALSLPSFIVIDFEKKYFHHQQ
ncbi:helix-turn-helix transcriptional regulator [Fusibacter bizertensis]|uniref:Helix-turn-helix transcriptional regulator n=1 Tax=Fusibacter bizertensis TaxID=1488331 RepID=A0ABT6NF58_9FIRM|nr:helix-turn-helix transcriptional regulator [Fusibacter bizertensis]MDH8679000.1 helix-turn-helix transcriptional regulator [Fusibacter bizertensis]